MITPILICKSLSHTHASWCLFHFEPGTIWRWAWVGDGDERNDKENPSADPGSSKDNGTAKHKDVKVNTRCAITNLQNKLRLQIVHSSCTKECTHACMTFACAFAYAFALQHSHHHDRSRLGKQASVAFALGWRERCVRVLVLVVSDDDNTALRRPMEHKTKQRAGEAMSEMVLRQVVCILLTPDSNCNCLRLHNAAQNKGA